MCALCARARGALGFELSRLLASSSMHLSFFSPQHTKFPLSSEALGPRQVYNSDRTLRSAEVRLVCVECHGWRRHGARSSLPPRRIGFLRLCSSIVNFSANACDASRCSAIIVGSIPSVSSVPVEHASVRILECLFFVSFVERGMRQCCCFDGVPNRAACTRAKRQSRRAERTDYVARSWHVRIGEEEQPIYSREEIVGWGHFLASASIS